MKTKILHPFFFSIYPVLFLYAKNIYKTDIREIYIPLLITVTFTVIFYLLLNLIVKNEKKTAIIISIFLISFFSFGYIVKVLYFMGSDIEEIYILITCLILFIVLLLFIMKYEPVKITHILNIFGTVLTLLSLFSIIISCSGIYIHKVPPLKKEIPVILQKKPCMPDIYYIILDTYTDGETLEDIFYYDNSEFLNYLKQKGFYIAGKSRANYCWTVLSIASSLNFDYLHMPDRHEKISKMKISRELMDLIENNRFASLLKKEGYTFISFATTDYSVNIRNADLYIDNVKMTEFQLALLRNTPLTFIISPLDVYRSNFSDTMEEFADIKRINSPKFVFALLHGLHSPLLFGAGGEPLPYEGYRRYWTYREKELYKERYKNQVIFMNKEMEKLIDNILSNSSVPPVIILQGDHGPDLKGDKYLKGRMSILNAYYVSQKCKKKLYEHITPVNTFRIILNGYFNTDLPVLRDKIYFSTGAEYYKVIDVTDRVK
jgi:hypothetical protein